MARGLSCGVRSRAREVGRTDVCVVRESDEG
jgi:hypothetical protein